ncbi:penicillin-binding transpeptidase domain-containing protein [Alkalihalobacillus sp. FSL R5-0424]
MRHTRKGLMVTGLATSLLLTGCFGDEPDPKETLNAFLENWSAEQYEEMYAKLDEATKQNISQDEYIERMTTLYEQMQANALQLEAVYPEDAEENEPEEGVYTVPLNVEITTSIGELAFEEDISLTLEEQEEGEHWVVNWQDTLVYPSLSEGGGFELASIQPTRGEIFDRNGNGLAVNGEVLQIGSVPGRIEDREDFVSEFSEVTGVSRETIESRLDQSWVTDEAFVQIHYAPASQIDWAQEELRDGIPGASYEVHEGREYPYGESAAHITGYIRDITAEQLEEFKDQGYGPNDKLGQTGLERAYEERLRGKSGGVLYTTNDGEREEAILETEAEDGEDITLTIDMELQQELSDEIGDDSGTATAMHPKNGQVLALVSKPTFDPNLAAVGFTQRQREDIDTQDNPQMNRFAQTYSPGSTFKLLTAAMGLEAGTLDPNETMDVNGKSWQPEGSDWGGYEVTRVNDYGEPIDLRKALVYSDNIYFAQQALNLGEEEFTNRANEFGFGEDLPIPLFHTSSLTAEGSMTNDIQLADSGYGQGQIQMNPLHLGLTFTTLVNEGNMIKPVLELDEESGMWKEGLMTPEHAELLQQDLVDVLEDSKGTAKAAAVEGVRIAGKTGTAELKATKDKPGQEHGWFVALEADDDPELLVVMMIDDVSDKGGSGYVVDKVASILESNLR